ncbi:MAG: hypothetical protein KatS3mg085_511 [Candidatus Dojkabacteria bacterium]|nr:MAG: hypothetical protein KatS3mg085_511 [Candidatus Dojkabacteria bacterium]
MAEKINYKDVPHFDPNNLIHQFLIDKFNSIHELNEEYEKLRNIVGYDLQNFQMLYFIYQLHLKIITVNNSGVFAETKNLTELNVSEIIQTVENMITDAYTKKLIENLIQYDFDNLTSLKTIYATILNNLLKSQVPLNFLEIYLTFYLEPIFLGKLKSLITNRTNFEH